MKLRFIVNGPGECIEIRPAVFRIGDAPEREASVETPSPASILLSMAELQARVEERVVTVNLASAIEIESATRAGWTASRRGGARRRPKHKGVHAGKSGCACCCGWRLRLEAGPFVWWKP